MNTLSQIRVSHNDKKIAIKPESLSPTQPPCYLKNENTASQGPELRNSLLVISCPVFRGRAHPGVLILVCLAPHLALQGQTLVYLQVPQHHFHGRITGTGSKQHIHHTSQIDLPPWFPGPGVYAWDNQPLTKCYPSPFPGKRAGGRHCGLLLNVFSLSPPLNPPSCVSWVPTFPHPANCSSPTSLTVPSLLPEPEGTLSPCELLQCPVQVCE